MALCLRARMCVCVCVCVQLRLERLLRCHGQRISRSVPPADTIGQPEEQDSAAYSRTRSCLSGAPVQPVARQGLGQPHLQRPKRDTHDAWRGLCNTVRLEL